MKKSHVTKESATMLYLRLILMSSVAIAWLTSCGRSSTETKQITWENCLQELVTYDHLPRLDGRHIQFFSSHDRSGGNNDFNNFAGRGSEVGWVTLVDLKGPGCIRRFWMTGSDPGHPIRLYLDGEKKPTIDTTIDDLFGQTAPWVPPLAQYVNMCFYSYLPVTYNRSIRIEIKEPNVHPIWGPRRIFYQIAAETFSPDTAVQSYPAVFSPSQLALAAEVGKKWQNAIDSRVLAVGDNQNFTTIQSREAADILKLDGPAVISQWTINVQPADTEAWTTLDQENLLKDAVLRVYYDNQSEPSIHVPLGDFFANAWRKRAYGSLWLTSGTGGYECRLPLPFRENLRMEILNGADQTISVDLTYSTTARPEGEIGYLHAEYRKSGPGGNDHHTVTRINGRGKFLGCFLGVTGLDPSWWILEGDERMWVDSSSTPVWYGTGLEDYFNGGWYYRGAVFGALNANFDRSPFRVAQFRHQHPDPVSFNHFFAMEFERMRYEQNNQPVVGYFESVAYYYLDRPSVVQPVPSRSEDRRAVEDPYHQKTFMLQLVELERSNDFDSALRAVREYLERYPESEEIGVYKLRALEYQKLLGENVTDADYEPYLNGSMGKMAQEQATLLQWFYAGENRAIVGLYVNGRGRLFLDGKMILNGDHPFHLFASGIELDQGPHQLAAMVDWQRDSAWLQAGIRTHSGVVGTGPGTATSRSADGNWRTAPVESLNWHQCGIRDIGRGVPDAPYLGGIANAFVLVQSKSYPVSAPDWMYYKGMAHFRQDFVVPINGWPTFSRTMTGLLK